MLGRCPMCDEKKMRLTEHHVVEAPPDTGETPSIHLCEDCHTKHERYRNYLRDTCGIDIDRTRQ
ncbi:MAG: hypothetical protein MPJ06_00885 [Nitrosopumilus sp.]|nr:hypothetical protein [Nitrosopumilus sp.]MDA7942553.1 hypothetical protein [Nitrosopumilus sp.]